jgi:hypothetical protein
MLLAQNEELRITSEACAQRGRLTANLTILWAAPALKPQVALAIKLVLQMMRERFGRGLVAGTTQRTVPRSPCPLPLDHDRVPLANLCTDIALACCNHARLRFIERPAEAILSWASSPHRVNTSRWGPAGGKSASGSCDTSEVATLAEER